MIKRFVVFVCFLLVLIMLPNKAYATVYDLTIPPGPYSRGDEFKVTISIDTEGNSLTSASVGFKYDKRYLQYIDTVAGDTLSTITADPQSDDGDNGRLIISGSNSSDYSGSGVFAYVTLKIIASSPGSAQICALWEPPTSPTPTSSPLTPTPTSLTPTSPLTPNPTSPLTPNPTRLPTTGNEKPVVYGGVVGIMFTAIASSVFLFSRFSKKK